MVEHGVMGLASGGYSLCELGVYLHVRICSLCGGGIKSDGEWHMIDGLVKVMCLRKMGQCKKERDDCYLQCCGGKNVVVW
jgi:hypothetical protein